MKRVPIHLDEFHLTLMRNYKQMKRVDTLIKVMIGRAVFENVNSILNLIKILAEYEKLFDRVVVTEEQI